MKTSHQKIPPNVTEIILESVSDGVFTVDKDWFITSFNRAAEKITGVTRKEAIGKQCCEVFRSNMCEMDCALRRTMKSGKPYVDSSTYIVNAEKQRIPVVVSTSVLIDEQGHILGGVETFRDLSVVEQLRRELDARYQIGDIVSRSTSMQKLLNILPQVADNDSTILIQGETGTGKEVVARTIHGLSPRKEKPFVAINCSALPDTLLESELFGYKAGAFTGAAKDKPGHFSSANGGTIFLDEIGDVSPAFQVKLLRVLQERTFTPLGGTKPVKINVRVITASNKNLDDLVAQGTFRQDLYYRIHVMRLDLPPLRDRREDIPLLAQHFVDKINRIKGKNVTGIHPDVLKILMAHDYPGNVRELENMIEHAFILCPSGEIGPECLPEQIRNLQALQQPQTIRDARQNAEAEMILNALKQHQYNRLAAAKALGMHKSTLFRKIKALGLRLPQKGA